MERGLAGGHGANTHLRDPEDSSAAVGAVAECARSKAKETGAYRVAPEDARLVAPGACSVTHLILQRGVEDREVGRDRVGNGTGGGNLVNAGILDYLGGYTDIGLLAGEVRVRTTIQP